MAFVRPEKIVLSQTDSGDAANKVKGNLQLASFLGSYTECEVKVGGQSLSVKIQKLIDKAAAQEAEKGIYCHWNAEDVLIMPTERG
ncbi:TOBE domain [Mycobacterium tuberculosis]|nr:TOBE domain [Mycobacterium tuberculosis]